MCRTLLPNASLLIYGSLRLEALASSTIEGTIASPEELLRFEAVQRSPGEQVREVNNYVQALEWGAGSLAGGSSIDEDLILGLHSRLLSGVRGSGRPGAYKAVPNRVGPHRPPPPGMETESHMSRLIDYLNGTSAESRVAQCALVHYQFETIHPFSDGNGRVGRLLILLQLISLGLLSAPLVYPSVIFESRKPEYIDCLQGVRDRGEWSEWIMFFSRSLREACRSTIALTNAMIALRGSMLEAMGDVRRRASMVAVLEAFFRDPVLTVSEISDAAGLSKGAVRNALIELQGLNIVQEIGRRRRGGVYACSPVIDVIFGVPGQRTDEAGQGALV
jgi:Fic family protein